MNAAFFWWSEETVLDHRSAPDHAVPGNLMIDDEGRISLELDGSLPNFIEALGVIFRGDAIVSDRNIQGILRGTGNPVLLLRPWRSSGVVTSVPYARFSVSIRRAPWPGRIRQRRRGVGTFSNARAAAPVTWQPGDR